MATTCTSHGGFISTKQALHATIVFGVNPPERYNIDFLKDADFEVWRLIEHKLIAHKVCVLP